MLAERRRILAFTCIQRVHDAELAKYYPEDKDFLLEFEPRVVHYKVVGQSWSVCDSAHFELIDITEQFGQPPADKNKKSITGKTITGTGTPPLPHDRPSRPPAVVKGLFFAAGEIGGRIARVAFSGLILNFLGDGVRDALGPRVIER